MSGRGGRITAVAVAMVAVLAVSVLAAAGAGGAEGAERRATEGEGAGRHDHRAWRSEAGTGPGARPPAQPSGDLSPAADREPPATDHVLVRFAAGTSGAEQQQALRRAGAGPAEPVLGPGTWRARVTPSQVDAVVARLQSSPGVEIAEGDPWVAALGHLVQPDDPHFPDQWALRNVRLPQAWQVEQGDPSVVVAVLDSGADLDHPELVPALLPGVDIVNGDADPDDDHGHGTAVAGIVAAAVGNGRGGAGACPGCSVVPVKVLNAEALGLASDVAAGIVWAVDHGADIVNLSLGSTSAGFALTDAVRYALDNGVVVVAAAGNSGTGDLTYPAATEGVIAVAGTDIEGDLASWSNWGPWVEAAAPGCNVAPLRGGGSGSICGTSAAAPLLAGVLGIAWSWSSATPAPDLVATLYATDRPVDGVGGGQPDAERLLNALGAAVPDGRET